MSERRNGLITASIFFIIAVVFFVLTLNMTSKNAQFPRVICIFMALVSILLAIKNLRAKEEGVNSAVKIQSLMKALFLVGVIFIYVLVLEKIGFLISTILMLYIVSIFFKYPKPLKLLVISIVFPTVLYLVFKYLLEIRLPAGILPF